MSNEKDRNENEDLTPFEASLAALRPRADGLDPQWRSLLAKEAVVVAEGGAEGVMAGVMLKHNLRGSRECVSPAGHRFLCVYCGSELPAVVGVRRWAWPLATAALATAAAVLLVMLVAGRETQIASHATVPLAAGSGRAVERKTIEGKAETHGRRADDAQRAERRESDGDRRILTVADSTLPDDFFERSNSLASNGAASFGDMKASEGQFRNAEFLQQLLREAEMSGGASGRLMSEPSNSKENRL